jgi:hypothetical protein
MATQEQTFRAYYSSMTDEELLAIAANRTSFIDVAQRFMSAELLKRHLTAPAETHAHQQVQVKRSLSGNGGGLLGKLKRVFLR